MQQRRATEEEAREAEWRQNAAARTENVESDAQVSAHNGRQVQPDTTWAATRSDGVELELHTSHLASGPDEPEGQVVDGAGSFEARTGVRNFSLFDNEEGEDWQQEPDDWWQQEQDWPAVQAEADHDAVNHDGESVQAAINSRLRRTTRLTFFDDESGEEDQQYEPVITISLLALWIKEVVQNSLKPRSLREHGSA